MLLPIDHGLSDLGGMAHHEEGEFEKRAEFRDFPCLVGREVGCWRQNPPATAARRLCDHSNCLQSRKVTRVEYRIRLNAQVNDRGQRIGQVARRWNG